MKPPEEILEGIAMGLIEAFSLGMEQNPVVVVSPRVWEAIKDRTENLVAVGVRFVVNPECGDDDAFAVSSEYAAEQGWV